MNPALKRVLNGFLFTNLIIVPAVAQSIAANNAPRVFPASFAVATSGPASTGKSWITVVDATGDSISSEQPLVSSTSLGFAIDGTGTFGESIGTDNSLNYFQANSSLAPNTVGVNNLPAGGCTSNVTLPANQLYTLDITNNAINMGSATGTPGAYGIAQDGLTGMTPVAMTGGLVAGTTEQRYAIVSQGVPYGVACNNIPTQVTQTGSVTFFEPATGPISGGSISTGKCPVYGVTSSNGQRSFIVNRGDDSITVLNMVGASLDQVIALPLLGGAHAGPVYAEYVPTRGKLLVANYDNDTVSVINVQTDSKGADGPSFGTVVATVDLWNGAAHMCPVPNTSQSVPCSRRPAAIAALPDGSRAYIADQGTGAIDVLDLRVNQVVSTLAIPTGGHPRSLAVVANSSTNSLFSRVYVATPDSNVIPYIYAGDNLLFDTACADGGLCTASGNVSDLHVSTSTPTAGTANNTYTTRLPGAGQPCYQPNFTPQNLAACFTH